MGYMSLWTVGSRAYSCENGGRMQAPELIRNKREVAHDTHPYFKWVSRGAIEARARDGAKFLPKGYHRGTPGIFLGCAHSLLICLDTSIRRPEGP